MKTRVEVGSFSGPIWDVLTDHPEGISVPAVVELLVDDDRMRMRQSWLLSLSSEQRYRWNRERYRAMDPAGTGRDDQVWSVEQRYRYALLERVHWVLTETMRKHKNAIRSGSTTDGNNSKMSLLLFAVLRLPDNPDPGGEPLWLYKAGKAPAFYDPALPICACGKTHHKGDTWKRPWEYHQGLGTDPHLIKQNWVNETRKALAKTKLTGSRELLEQALNIITGKTA